MEVIEVVDMQTACGDLVNFVNEVKTKNYDKMGLSADFRDMVVCERLSSKWAKLIVCTKRDEDWTSRSVYCFVALKDIETKTLGKVKRGDIHKAATWSAPAKHSRGNVFNRESWSCCGAYGVAYLR